MTKYTLTTATAKRIAKAMRGTAAIPTNYADVLAALNAEGYTDAPRYVPELITLLHSDGDTWAVMAIGSACAVQARAARSILTDLRAGLRGLGLVFESDLKQEALNEL